MSDEEKKEETVDLREPAKMTGFLAPGSAGFKERFIRRDTGEDDGQNVQEKKTQVDELFDGTADDDDEFVTPGSVSASFYQSNIDPDEGSSTSDNPGSEDVAHDEPVEGNSSDDEGSGKHDEPNVVSQHIPDEEGHDAGNESVSSNAVPVESPSTKTEDHADEVHVETPGPVDPPVQRQRISFEKKSSDAPEMMTRDIKSVDARLPSEVKRGGDELIFSLGFGSSTLIHLVDEEFQKGIEINIGWSNLPFLSSVVTLEDGTEITLDTENKARRSVRGDLKIFGSTLDTSMIQQMAEGQISGLVQRAVIQFSKDVALHDWITVAHEDFLAPVMKKSREIYPNVVIFNLNARKEDS